MKKEITLEEAANLVKDGMSVMVGGFMGCGSPHSMIRKIEEKKVKDLSIICNDTSRVDYGIGKLVAAKQVSRVITSHIGTNRETGRQMNEEELQVELVPQGTLAERIRCAGAGLGGFLTPTGVGTVVEEGKEKMTLNGQEYLLELPLSADIALLAGAKVDSKGNVYYEKATRNFNPVMAMAAKTVIVEAKEIAEPGEIDPDHVVTPAIFVDYIVKGEDFHG